MPPARGSQVLSRRAWSRWPMRAARRCGSTCAATARQLGRPVGAVQRIPAARGDPHHAAHACPGDRPTDGLPRRHRRPGGRVQEAARGRPPSAARCSFGNRTRMAINVLVYDGRGCWVCHLGPACRRREHPVQSEGRTAYLQIEHAGPAAREQRLTAITCRSQPAASRNARLPWPSLACTRRAAEIGSMQWSDQRRRAGARTTRARRGLRERLSLLYGNILSHVKRFTICRPS